jgi:hypothetical protein
VSQIVHHTLGVCHSGEVRSEAVQSESYPLPYTMSEAVTLVLIAVVASRRVYASDNEKYRT